jgi:hypothetical protein
MANSKWSTDNSQLAIIGLRISSARNPEPAAHLFMSKKILFLLKPAPQYVDVFEDKVKKLHSWDTWGVWSGECPLVLGSLAKPGALSAKIRDRVDKVSKWIPISAVDDGELVREASRRSQCENTQGIPVFMRADRKITADLGRTF